MSTENREESLGEIQSTVTGKHDKGKYGENETGEYGAKGENEVRRKRK